MALLKVQAEGSVLAFNAEPDSPAPSLQPGLGELNAAIASAEGFLDGLSKELDPESLTMSEYYGFPLGVRQVNEDATEIHRLVGRNGDGSEISHVYNLEENELFVISFPGQKIEVGINWNYSTDDILFILANSSLDVARSDVFLSDQWVCTFTKENIGEKFRFIIAKKNAKALQSFRYTDRHGTQSAFQLQLARANIDAAVKLANQLQKNGYAPGLDLHSPIWGGGSEYTSRFPQSQQVYHDCEVATQTNSNAFQYHSKVCYSIPAYQVITEFDNFIPLVEALEVLNKYSDPYKAVDGLQSPVEVAEALIRDFEDSAETGIGMRTVTGYNRDVASGIRTAHFGALAARLGYEYGLDRYKIYADKVARILLHQQIGADGAILTADGRRYYRPAQSGGLLMAWDRSLRAQFKKPLYYQAIDLALNANEEYSGIIASNTETTSDADAFFRLYRRLVYHQY